MSTIARGSSVTGSTPTRKGTRRRPPAREVEQVRPSAVYHRALEISFARMVVIENLRDDGFRTS
jgi:hypothetical protein